MSGEEDSVSQSVQLQHMETTSVFHRGLEWEMKKNLICATRVTERKENETMCLWKWPAQEESNPLFPWIGGGAHPYISLLLYAMKMSSLTKNFCSLYMEGPDRHSLANEVPAAYRATALAACAVPDTGFCRVSKMDKMGGVLMPQLLQFTAWWFKLIHQTWTGAPEVWAHIPAAGGGDYLLNYCK